MRPYKFRKTEIKSNYTNLTVKWTGEKGEILIVNTTTYLAPPNPFGHLQVKLSIPLTQDPPLRQWLLASQLSTTSLQVGPVYPLSQTHE